MINSYRIPNPQPDDHPEPILWILRSRYPLRSQEQACTEDLSWVVNKGELQSVHKLYSYLLPTITHFRRAVSH